MSVRIAWVAALLSGLIRAAHTGDVVVRVRFHQGGIRDVRVTHEEVIATAP